MFLISDIGSLFEGCLLQTCVSKIYKPTLHTMLQNELSTCLNENTHNNTKTHADLKNSSNQLCNKKFSKFSSIRTLTIGIARCNAKHYKYLSCVPGVDGKIHPEGVVQHRR